MKKLIYISTFLLFPLLMIGQEIETNPEISTEKTTQKTAKKSYREWNKRISFFVGAGVSMVGSKIYEKPVIDYTTNNVIIEEAGKTQPNISMGIVYTPFVYSVKSKVNYRDADGFIQTKYIDELVPKNFSAALFMNPVNITSSNRNKTNSIDLGFGLGWRSDTFSIFATMEFFEIRQPKNHFIEEYKTNNKQYIVGGQIQNAIDINDNSIFKNQIMSSFGVKLAYTFDIVNRIRKEQ